MQHVIQEYETALEKAPQNTPEEALIAARATGVMLFLSVANFTSAWKLLHEIPDGTWNTWKDAVHRYCFVCARDPNQFPWDPKENMQILKELVNA